ncbi:diguanylate cyclase (GGDEF)-like protein [Bacillus ectoiniformans]|uniref:sensor domain-containing diguanylate cyclase n=1 Tax=Bacillus ectoiniformans TaxID=1494429 RepID=UPI00195DE94F|nr:sensor domain-containing diguanylate cyclase [Bacillus ectoiniformans]MBM7648193.1 diguanylate cyclase (GGDEF)-like protein [Bacillus ectoiniformans]
MNDFNHAPCGFVTISKRGMFIDVNETFLDLVKYSREELHEKHIESIMNIANKFLFHSHFYPFLQLYGVVEEVYLSLKSGTGEDIPVLLNGKCVERDGTEVIDCVFVKMHKRIHYEQEIRSIKKRVEEAYEAKDEALKALKLLHIENERKQKELVALNAELERLAATDDLTGLKNRRYFLEQLEECISLFSKAGTPFSLLILDVDHFKKVNDTWGHLAGDQILRELAKIMESEAGKADTVARYGGEEFIIILPAKDEVAAKRKAEKLRSAIEHATWEVCSITVSIGVSTFMAGDTNVSILSKADRALYASKANGRNKATHAMELDDSRLNM